VGDPERQKFSGVPAQSVVVGVQFDPIGDIAPLVKYLASLSGSNWGPMRSAEALGQVQIDPVLLGHRFERKPTNSRLIRANHDTNLTLALEDGWAVVRWDAVEAGEDPYPGHEALLTEISTHVSAVESAMHTRLPVNLWEMGYVNAFICGNGWRTLSDWHLIVPGLVGPQPHLNPDSRSEVDLNWVTQRQDLQGRLMIRASHARSHHGGKERALLLELVAQGRIGAGDDWRACVAKGHQSINAAFAAVVSKEITNAITIARGA